MDIFNACHKVNDLLSQNSDVEARNELIKLLDYHETHEIPYGPLLNQLIRETGLYPYLEMETASWQERFIYEAFKVDTGGPDQITLHRDQSLILKRLLSGESLAVSAPTSFGKSFIVDSFISVKKPKNVVIIVPTIALTDETRRRIQKKFAREYKIITTSDVNLAEKNILIFPQERAIGYVDKIDSVDMLIIDEFYKASVKFDKERAPALLKAILKLGDKSKQKYFLSPHISKINESPFTSGMAFLPLDFNTVFLEKKDLYKDIKSDDEKSEVLLKILKKDASKSLIYAGTYSSITNIANLIIANIKPVNNELLDDFSKWLSVNYDRNWILTNLVKRGAGIHNGQLHRSLSQIQVRLFEEKEGIRNLISTSSIIEGVNTSAENVIIWKNKNGVSKLNDFTYRNIIGRGGRMFRHFIGKIYILEKPPESEETQLDLVLEDAPLADIDEEQFKKELSKEKIAKIIEYKEEMSQILGHESFARIQKENSLQGSDSALVLSIAHDINSNRDSWESLKLLNSQNVSLWNHMLLKTILLQPSGWDSKYSHFVEFVRILSQNWDKSIPQLLRELDDIDIGVDQFFKLERVATFKLSALLHDVNVIQKEILHDKTVDISPFVARLSHAFLPSAVYQLEEYGLPRMISKKLHRSGLIDFDDQELTLHAAIDMLIAIGVEHIKANVNSLDRFDHYILDYFFDGITPEIQSSGVRIDNTRA